MAEIVKGSKDLDDVLDGPRTRFGLNVVDNAISIVTGLVDDVVLFAPVLQLIGQAAFESCKSFSLMVMVNSR